MSINRKRAGVLPGVVLALWISPAGAADSPVPMLFDPAKGIDKDWLRHSFLGETEWTAATFADRPAIRARGRNSATVLVRQINVDWRKCPEIEWSWAVTAVQPSADIRAKGTDDVAASISLLFGDPGSKWWPKAVPMLRYAWTSGNEPAGRAIPNPYAPKVVMVVAVERGAARLGEWRTYRRNVALDYAQAFGRPPEAAIQALSIFSDNDQTKEPVEAFYGAARAVCRP